MDNTTVLVIMVVLCVSSVSLSVMSLAAGGGGIVYHMSSKQNADTKERKERDLRGGLDNECTDPNVECF
jgi:hypothetical protein